MTHIDIENKRIEELLEGLEKRRVAILKGDVKSIAFVSELMDGEVTTNWASIDLPGKLMVMAYTLLTDAMDNLMQHKYEVRDDFDPDNFATDVCPSIDNRNKSSVLNIKEPALDIKKATEVQLLHELITRRKEMQECPKKTEYHGAWVSLTVCIGNDYAADIRMPQDALGALMLLNT